MKKNKTDVITFRVTKEHKRIISKASKIDGRNQTNYCRDLIVCLSEQLIKAYKTETLTDKLGQTINK